MDDCQPNYVLKSCIQRPIRLNSTGHLSWVGSGAMNLLCVIETEKNRQKTAKKQQKRSAWERKNKHYYIYRTQVVVAFAVADH